MKRKSHKPSEAQRWAQKRNWSKARLVGVKGTLTTLAESKLLLENEKSNARVAKNFIIDLIDDWDGNNLTSKEIYLCS